MTICPHCGHDQQASLQDQALQPPLPGKRLTAGKMTALFVTGVLIICVVAPGIGVSLLLKRFNEGWRRERARDVAEVRSRPVAPAPNATVPPYYAPPPRGPEPAQVQTARAQGLSAEVVNMRMVAHSTPDGRQMVMVVTDLKNMGTQVIRGIAAEILVFDGQKRKLSNSTPHQWIYSKKGGIQPGETYHLPLADGYPLMLMPGKEPPAYCDVRIVEIR